MRRRIIVSFAAFTAAALAATASGYSIWRSLSEPPAEYKTLEVILNKLNDGNKLGKANLAFMITAGPAASELAWGRGLCRGNLETLYDQCVFFSLLNPFKTYKNGWDEIIRQSYAMNLPNAWAYSNGTILLPRSLFRKFNNNNSHLACIIAHELSHELRSHAFELNYYYNHNLKGLSEKDKEAASMKLQRQHELKADRDASIMVFRAGFKGRPCITAISEVFRLNGDGSNTEADSTHPGFDERMNAMKINYIELEKNPPKQVKSVKRVMYYNKPDNLLLFTRKKN
jgi:hypothetical protein